MHTYPLSLENVPEALQHPSIPIGQAVCPLALQPHLHRVGNPRALHSTSEQQAS